MHAILIWPREIQPHCGVPMTPAQPKGTKERLLFAAVHLFARKGFKVTTVREICDRAGSANINSVHYYFGSKEGLYREILELLFASHADYEQKYAPAGTAREKLERFVTSYCAMLYGEGEIARDFIRIFNMEIAQPSRFLDALVVKHTKPQTLAFLEVVRDLLGPQVPEDAVRDTCISIGSQILYYSYAWPVFSRVFPDHPGMERYFQQLAEHIITFSLGGIAAVRKKYKVPR
jgi:AcrR family transcriptional regulator